MIVNVTARTFRADGYRHAPLSEAPGREQAGQNQMGCGLEYRDEEAMRRYIPFWKEVEDGQTGAMDGIMAGFRGVVIDDIRSQDRKPEP